MAREDRNSPYRDYYVWTDDPKQYKDARIIFIDTEESNWVRARAHTHDLSLNPGRTTLQLANAHITRVCADCRVAVQTWDEKAGQYYWHRFYSSQPDLKYASIIPPNGVGVLFGSI
jgi:glycosidase